MSLPFYPHEHWGLSLHGTLSAHLGVPLHGFTFESAPAQNGEVPALTGPAELSEGLPYKLLFGRYDLVRDRLILRSDQWFTVTDLSGTVMDAVLLGSTFTLDPIVDLQRPQ